MRRRLKWALSLLAVALAAAAVAIPAVADSNHGRPSCAGQLDELGFGSRDGWDNTHLSNPDVFGSLQELEGYLNVCRTNDSVIVEAVSGSARAVLVRGVVRVQLRAVLQRFWDPPDARTLGWHDVVSSASVNTGVNRTLTVTTPTVNEVGSTPAHEHRWHRVVRRSLTRYSNGSLRFVALPTYAIWLGDGPVSPATPPS